MMMQQAPTVLPLNGVEASGNRRGWRGYLCCFLCSFLRGRSRSLGRYCLRSTRDLEALDDRTLRDIGIHRSWIPSLMIAGK